MNVSSYKPVTGKVLVRVPGGKYRDTIELQGVDLKLLAAVGKDVAYMRTCGQVVQKPLAMHTDPDRAWMGVRGNTSTQLYMEDFDSSEIEVGDLVYFYPIALQDAEQLARDLFLVGYEHLIAKQTEHGLEAIALSVLAKPVFDPSARPNLKGVIVVETGKGLEVEAKPMPNLGTVVSVAKGAERYIPVGRQLPIAPKDTVVLEGMHTAAMRPENQHRNLWHNWGLIWKEAGAQADYLLVGKAFSIVALIDTTKSPAGV